jgi:hypothetical protein
MSINPSQQERFGGSDEIDYIAFCGNDCTLCPLFKQSCPEGCLGELCAHYCNTCEVRLCNLDRHQMHCAQCPIFPCQKLKRLYKKMKKEGYGHWASAAHKVLDIIRKQSN